LFRIFFFLSFFPFFTLISPEYNSVNLNKATINEDFPDPVLPTIPIRCPG